MDHESAVRLQAAERYLLDEFSPEERREFEDHFFGCRECADEVRAASIFSANTRAVFRGQPAPAVKLRSHPSAGTRARLFWPLLASAALNLGLLFDLGYHRFALNSAADQTPSQRPQQTAHQTMDPQFYRSFGAPAASRGVAPPVLIPAGSQFFGARFDLPPGRRVENLTYQIVGTSVRSEHSLKAPAGLNTDLELAVPVNSLAPGEYQLILFAKEESQLFEISRLRFIIER